MNEKDFYNVAVATIKTNKDGVIAIIRKNGIAINSGANDQTIQNAVLSLLKTSPAFKKDFGDLIMEANATYSASGKTELDSILLETKVEDSKDKVSGKKSDKKSGFWGDVFNPDFTRNTLDNIMNIVSVKLGAGNTTPYSGMSDASSGFPPKDDDKGNGSANSGLSVGSIVGISLGVIAIIGAVVYFVRKK